MTVTAVSDSVCGHSSQLPTWPRSTSTTFCGPLRTASWLSSALRKETMSAVSSSTSVVSAPVAVAKPSSEMLPLFRSAMRVEREAVKLDRGFEDAGVVRQRREVEAVVAVEEVAAEGGLRLIEVKRLGHGGCLRLRLSVRRTPCTSTQSEEKRKAKSVVHAFASGWSPTASREISGWRLARYPGDMSNFQAVDLSI